MATLTDIFLAENGDFVVGAGGDFFLAEDEASIEADIRHLLLTPPGSAPWDPEYGVGVQLWLGLNIGRSRLKALSDRIKAQLDRDDRLQPGFATVKFQQNNEEWTVFVTALTLQGSRVTTSVNNNDA